MNFLRAICTCGLSVVILGGCATNELMVKRQTEAEAKIEHLFQVAGGIEARLNEQNSRLATSDEKTADHLKQLQELRDSVRELRESNLILQQQLKKAATPATPKIEVVNPEPAPKGKEIGPPAEYVKAFGLYSSNNFSAAIQAFEMFLKSQPGSDYAPNATYWIAECYYTTNNLSKAMEFFQKVAETWPSHPKAADSLLKLGYSYTALKQPDKAKAAYDKIIRSYPGSPAAIKAREKLTVLQPEKTT